MLPTIKAWEQGNLPLTKVRNKGQATAIRMVGPALHLKDINDRRIDISVLTASLTHQCTYNAKPDSALKIEKMTNERLTEFVAQAPERFLGLGSVPMQSVPMAVAELKQRTVLNSLKDGTHRASGPGR